MAKMNKEKEIARRRIALGHPTWEQCCYNGVQQNNSEASASVSYEIFSSCAKFLARFVQQSSHPEDETGGRSRNNINWEDWRSAPWESLRELRAHGKEASTAE